VLPFHIAKKLGIPGKVVVKSRKKYVLVEDREDLLQPSDVARAIFERSGRIVDEFGYVEERVAKVLASANLSLFMSLSIDRGLAELLAELLLRSKAEDLRKLPNINEDVVRVALSMLHFDRYEFIVYLYALLAPVYFLFPEEAAKALCAKIQF